MSNLVLAAGGDDGYQISRSVRFRRSASASFSRTPGSASNRTTWSWSGWTKRGQFGLNGQTLFTGGTNTTNSTRLSFDLSDRLVVENEVAGVTTQFRVTTAVYRDPSAWMHVVLAVDTTNATAANRIRLYVNGSEVTVFTTNNAPTASQQLQVNAVNPHYIGQSFTPAYADFYLADVNFIDGLALTPDSFGEIDSVTGVWKPKRYTGTYGTNGFFLDFSDNSAATATAIGKDRAGSNNWTPTNISVSAGATYDSMLDVPTQWTDGGNGRGNYATLNPLHTGRSTLSNANLTASGTTDLPTIIPDSGNWYFEIDGVAKNWTPPAAFPAAAGNYNFGQRPFTNAITSNHKPLHTGNLPEPSIKKPNQWMDATPYSGTGATQSIVNSGATQPNLVWTKSRNSGLYNHRLFDSVRGPLVTLQSSATAAEVTEANSLTAFNSNGFAVGSDAAGGGVNFSGVTYIGWQWKEGATPGFDIVTYTGTGANQLINHSLGVSPAMIIAKARSAVDNWFVWHKSMGATVATQTLFLNATDPLFTSTTGNVWGFSSFSSTQFLVGDRTGVNQNGVTHVAYLFSEVASFSRFGSYTGNGSADGPFVYCGFRPKFVMVKRTDAAGQWYILDTGRDTYNIAANVLFANLSNAESPNSNILEELSNGFKLRNTNTDSNASGGSYIFMAFAENPFKYSLAR